MRMLKCYLASDSSGHLVTAGEAMRAAEQAWSCASCGLSADTSCGDIRGQSCGGGCAE